MYLSFLTRGSEYNMLGLVKTDLRLFGPKESGEPMFIFGTDRLGRDMLSRVIFGARFTLSMGLIGVILSTIIHTFNYNRDYYIPADEVARTEQRMRIEQLAERFELLADGERFRLHAGPYESVDAARSAAERMGSLLKLKPFVVVR